MYTIINSGAPLVAIGMPGNTEYGLTNVSQVQLPTFNYVRVGTGSNQVTYTNLGLRDGAIVAVDPVGLVEVTDGADVQLWAIVGFSTGLTVLGFFVFIRWAYRVFGGGAGVYRDVAD